MPKQTSSQARRPRRKARRPGVVPAPPPPHFRPRVSPIGGTGSVEQKPVVARPRTTGMMDFSYIKGELRRVVVVAAVVITLLIVLAVVLR